MTVSLAEWELCSTFREGRHGHCRVPALLYPVLGSHLKACKALGGHWRTTRGFPPLGQLSLCTLRAFWVLGSVLSSACASRVTQVLVYSLLPLRSLQITPCQRDVPHLPLPASGIHSRDKNREFVSWVVTELCGWARQPVKGPREKRKWLGRSLIHRYTDSISCTKREVRTVKDGSEGKGLILGQGQERLAICHLCKKLN